MGKIESKSKQNSAYVFFYVTWVFRFDIKVFVHFFIFCEWYDGTSTQQNTSQVLEEQNHKICLYIGRLREYYAE